MAILVAEMIEQTRAMTDEFNISDLSEPKILAALNRAQLSLTRLSGKHFPEMLKRDQTFSTFTGPENRSVTIPNGSAAFTVNQVDVIFGAVTYRVDYTNSTNVTQFEVNQIASIPSNYTIQGNTLNLYPRPQAGVQIRVKYQLRPPKLVESMGRITDFDEANGYIYLDSIVPVADGGPSTNTSDLSCFVNVINQNTGDVTGTYQIINIDTEALRLTIKSTALFRSIVYGRTVSATLSSDIALDDQLTSAQGSCIPIYFSDFYDYLVQYAVVDVKRTFTLPIDQDLDLLKELEEAVKTQWASRPTGLRIQARNKHWNRLYRRNNT